MFKKFVFEVTLLKGILIPEITDPEWPTARHSSKITRLKKNFAHSGKMIKSHIKGKKI